MMKLSHKLEFEKEGKLKIEEKSFDTKTDKTLVKISWGSNTKARVARYTPELHRSTNSQRYTKCTIHSI